MPPVSAPLDLYGELVCDWRDGDVWKPAGADILEGDLIAIGMLVRVI